MPAVDLVAMIPIPPDALPAAAALLVSYADVVRAEPGNLRFETYRDCDSGAMVVLERYTSQGAFEAHLSDPANSAFNAKLAEIIGGGASRLSMLEHLG